MSFYIKKTICIINVYLLLLSNCFAGVIISSIMPNTSDDTTLEYIELYNSGSIIESLSGYILEDLSGKQFEFSSGYFLEGLEYKKYYRPETKVLLNNSDEEIFLYNNSGVLLDSFGYESSEEGKEILVSSGELIESSGSFEPSPLTPLPEVEVNNSGSLEDVSSGELIESSGSLEEFSSGELETSPQPSPFPSMGQVQEREREQDIIENIYIKNPEIIIQSGLDEDNKCRKEDCKINLNYEISNSNLACEWDFGEGYFNTSDTESKCNPGYVTYSYGDFRVELKVYQKNLSSNYKKSYLYFSNKKIIEIEEKIENSNNNTQSPYPNSEVSPHPNPLPKGEGIENESPHPSSLSQAWEEGIEQNVDDNGNNKFTNLKGEDGKFVVKYGTGDDLVFDDEGYYNYIQNSFKIYYRKLDKGLKIYGKTLSNTKVKIEINKKEEFSFLDFFIAKASANYIYETISDDNGDYEFLLTEIGIGNFEIDSYILDNYGNDISLEKEKSIDIDDDYLNKMQAYLYEKFLENKKFYSDEPSSLSLVPNGEENIDELKPIIEIQGKIGDNKKLVGNVLFCYEKCSVNFDGRASEGKIVNYIWNFGNGETAEGKNPGYVKYEDYGKYSVTLMTSGDNGKIETKYFYVIFEEKLSTKKDDADVIKDVEIEKANNLLQEQNDIDDESQIESQEIVLDEQQDSIIFIILYIFIIILIIAGILVLLRKEKLI